MFGADFKNKMLDLKMNIESLKEIMKPVNQDDLENYYFCKIIF